MLIWTDLETTGLDEETETILEIAAIATDDNLNELSRFHAVTNEAKNRSFNDLHPVVQDMHTKNGLWAQSLVAPFSLRKVAGELSGWLRAITPAPTAAPPQLAGSTISFDRAFLKKHCRHAHDLLHYRNLDVSSFNEAYKRWWPGVWEVRPVRMESSHRAMDDVLESIGVMRYYARHFPGYRALPGKAA